MREEFGYAMAAHRKELGEGKGVGDEVDAEVRILRSTLGERLGLVSTGRRRPPRAGSGRTLSSTLRKVSLPLRLPSLSPAQSMPSRTA
jgi:hypothetical protein